MREAGGQAIAVQADMEDPAEIERLFAEARDAYGKVDYFVANAAARAQGPEQRRYPRWLQVLGCAGCLVLVATLPWEAVVAGVLVFLVGIVVRVVRLRS